MNAKISTCVENKKAIEEEIQGINLHILALGKHCSSSASSKALSQLKSQRNVLYRQLSAVNAHHIRRRL